MVLLEILVELCSVQFLERAFFPVLVLIEWPSAVHRVLHVEIGPGLPVEHVEIQEVERGEEVALAEPGVLRLQVRLRVTGPSPLIPAVTCPGLETVRFIFTDAKTSEKSALDYLSNYNYDFNKNFRGPIKKPIDE